MGTELSSPISNDRASESSADSSAEETPDSVKCPYCGTVFAAGLGMCPHCRWPLTPVSAGERAAAAAAYLPLVPAAVLLLLPAFRKNLFVRFHAWQSIALWVVYFILIGATVALSSVASPMLVLLFGILVSLAMLFLWIVLTLKSWQGERFEIPVFGELAARLA